MMSYGVSGVSTQNTWTLNTLCPKHPPHVFPTTTRTRSTLWPRVGIISSAHGRSVDCCQHLSHEHYKKGEAEDTCLSTQGGVFHPATHFPHSISMQHITFQVSCQWTAILISAVIIIPIVLLVTLRPPRMLSTCNKVTFNSTTYHRLCQTPVEDHILLFCLISHWCNTLYTNMSGLTLHEEGTCRDLDYHMDCKGHRAKNV
jgi:hypothetical protein